MADGWGLLERRGRGLAEEATATVRAGKALDPVWLDSAAGWLAEEALPWAELMGEEPTGRQYRRIVSSLQLEAWLICWPEQGRLELHDHGGACGALRVVDGSLAEEYLLDRRLPARRRQLPVGAGISFDGDYIHDVVNQQSVLATSVHVYSSASRPMGYYRLTAAGLIQLPHRTDDAVVHEGEWEPEQPSQNYLDGRFPASGRLT